MNDEWRTIPGYSKYMICTDGKIVGPYKKILKPGHKKDGRAFVNIVDDTGIFRPVHVSRLLAMTFIRKIKKGEVVRHLNDDRKNDSLDNLAIGTQKENIEDLQRNRPDRFRNQPRNEKQKSIIREWLKKKSVEMYREGNHTQEQLGNIFGISLSGMCQRIRRLKD